MIENVESVKAKFELNVLMHGEGFVERSVKADERRSAAGISSHVAAGQLEINRHRR